MAQHIGVLTSGGDCPGLNAAIRGLGKAAESYGMKVTGFIGGFPGIAMDVSMELNSEVLSGILTDGGTILRTSRDKPHRMMIDGEERNMTAAIVETYQRHGLDALVCIGGGGTQKNALRLAKKGLNVVTLPKTIDNDISMTDRTFGFDTALGIATEAVDRLHSTATSHSRVIVVEVMGHRAGWLALESGIAGGADVILIPEIAYDVGKVAESIRKRAERGKRFSIVVVAEGAQSCCAAEEVAALVAERDAAETPEAKLAVKERLRDFHNGHVGHTIRLTRHLERLTGQESRLTILGHLQRGGTPTAGDRVFASWLGAECAKVLRERDYGVMLGLQGNALVRVPLKQVAGVMKSVPRDHPLVVSARALGVSFGD